MARDTCGLDEFRRDFGAICTFSGYATGAAVFSTIVLVRGEQSSDGRTVRHADRRHRAGKGAKGAKNENASGGG
jgi:hypothetical protein